MRGKRIPRAVVVVVVMVVCGVAGHQVARRLGWFVVLEEETVEAPRSPEPVPSPSRDSTHDDRALPTHESLKVDDIRPPNASADESDPVVTPDSYQPDRRFGPGTIPAARSPELFAIDYRDPIRVRNEDTDGIIHVQNRVFLSAEEEGGIRVQPVEGGAAISVGEGVVYRLSGVNTLTEIGRVTLRDNGRGTDEIASDGSFAASVPPAELELGDVPTRLIVRVPVTQRGVTTDVEFMFEYTGGAPAYIVGVDGAGIVDGSLLLRAHVKVIRPGLYQWLARLVRDDDTPVALLKTNGHLPMGDTTIDLVAHGLMLREIGTTQRLVLRDVEGWRIKIGGALPKEVVVPWRERFRVPPFDAMLLTMTTWSHTHPPQPLLPRSVAVPIQRR